MDPSDRGQEDPELLVAVRQVLVITFLLLGLFAACLSRHGSAVHLWLEGSWWLVATVLAAFLAISALFGLIGGGSDANQIFVLEILEFVELVIYLILAVFASLARRHTGRYYAIARTGFWVATIFIVVLWSCSSLINIITSGRATPATIITMTATVVTGVLMLADLCVTYWHRMDPSAVTEQQAEAQAHQPLLSDRQNVNPSGQRNGGEGGHEQSEGYHPPGYADGKEPKLEAVVIPSDRIQTQPAQQYQRRDDYD